MYLHAVAISVLDFFGGGTAQAENLRKTVVATISLKALFDPSYEIASRVQFSTSVTYFSMRSWKSDL